jgi:hypothetical protein
VRLSGAGDLRVKVSAPLLDSLAQWLEEKNVEVVY